MKANVILFFLAGIMLSFYSSAKGSITAGHECKPDSLPGNILIINSFDAMSMKARKNKKELFAELADSLNKLLYVNIVAHRKNQATILPELLKETENSDSSIFSMMTNNKATTAIVIKKLDVYFEKTGVDVTGEKHNKTRIASYDICSVVSYELYYRESKPRESETTFCEHFTERQVISGLLAAGPDVVGKRKHAFKIIAKNAERYLWEINF